MNFPIKLMQRCLLAGVLACQSGCIGVTLAGKEEAKDKRPFPSLHEVPDAPPPADIKRHQELIQEMTQAHKAQGQEANEVRKGLE